MENQKEPPWLVAARKLVGLREISGGVEPTIFNTASPVRDTDLPRVSDTALRLIALRINNPTGSPVVVSLTADVCWTQDLI